MKLLIKQRVFSWGDKYDIYDERGSKKYFVKSEIFSFGHNIHVYDLANNEVSSIKQHLFTFLPRFEIIVKGMSMGLIEKKFTLFRPKYELRCNGWNIVGDVFGWDYDISDSSGRTVMRISKELFNWGDTYALNIYEPQNEILGLTIAIAIDAANCSNK